MNESAAGNQAPARLPQVHSLDVRLSFRSQLQGRSYPSDDRAAAFWNQFRQLASLSSNDWRAEATPELLAADFERKVTWALGRQFSRRFLGRGGKRPMEFEQARLAPDPLYSQVKRVSFRCRVTGYSSLNLELIISGFQSLSDLFDRDFESFRVFFEPFLFLSLEEAYNGQLASSLEASFDFPTALRLDFEQPSPAESPRSSARDRASEKAAWLVRLVNGSLVVPVLLALIILLFGGWAVRDLHRHYVEGLSTVLELAVSASKNGVALQPPREPPATPPGGEPAAPFEPEPEPEPPE